MKLNKRNVVSAALGLVLAACGPVDEAGQEALEGQEQALPANCTSVDDTLMTDHACIHANNSGDNVNVTANTGASISTKHKHYTVTLPSGASGTVLFTPSATTAGDTSESVTFYLSQSVAFTVTSGGTTVTPGINEALTASTCSLVKAVTYDLTVGSTYTLTLGPATGNQVGVVAEYLDENRDRFYPDADGDTYGANTTYYTACEPPAGYATRRFDCNDGNASINPGATEVCGNGVDDNCDGVSC